MRSESRMSSSRPSQVIALDSREVGIPTPASGIPSAARRLLQPGDRIRIDTSKRIRQRVARHERRRIAGGARHVERDVVRQRLANEFTVRAGAPAERSHLRPRALPDGVGELQPRRIDGEEGVPLLVESIASAESHVDVGAGKATARGVEGGAGHARLGARRARQRSATQRHSVERGEVRRTAGAEDRRTVGAERHAGHGARERVQVAGGGRGELSFHAIAPLLRGPRFGIVGGDAVRRPHRFRGGDLHLGEQRGVASEHEVRHQLAFAPLPLHTAPRRLVAERLDRHEIIAGAILERERVEPARVGRGLLERAVGAASDEDGRPGDDVRGIVGHAPADEVGGGLGAARRPGRARAGKSRREALGRDGKRRSAWSSCGGALGRTLFGPHTHGEGWHRWRHSIASSVQRDDSIVGTADALP